MRATGDYYRYGSVSPDSRLLAVGTADGVEMWDLESGTRPPLFQPLGETPCVLFRPTSELLINRPGGLSRWLIHPGDTPGMTSKGQYPLFGSNFQIAQSRDGQVVAIAPGRQGLACFSSWERTNRQRR